MNVVRLAFLPMLVLLLAAAVQAPPPPEPWRPVPGTVLYSVGGAEGPVAVPRRFAVESNAIVECESSGRADFVGKAGELGRFQVHVAVHGPRMQTLGLNPKSERDRVAFAANVLWKEQGWAPWTCRP